MIMNIANGHIDIARETWYPVRVLFRIVMQLVKYEDTYIFCIIGRTYLSNNKKK